MLTTSNVKGTAERTKPRVFLWLQQAWNTETKRPLSMFTIGRKGAENMMSSEVLARNVALRSQNSA